MIAHCIEMQQILRSIIQCIGVLYSSYLPKNQFEIKLVYDTAELGLAVLYFWHGAEIPKKISRIRFAVYRIYSRAF